MAKLEATMDMTAIQPLLGVCRLQAEIINEFSRHVNSEKIDELQRMFKAANLDEPLHKIQREAFEAGFESVDYSNATGVSMEDCFDQWLERDE